MGRGNVCVFGECEGLYYIDNDFLDFYSKEDEDGELVTAKRREIDDFSDGWEFDELESDFERSWLYGCMSESIINRFPSFDRVNKWISNDRLALLENKLFYVVIEDNEWSIAVELIQKENEYGSEELFGLQKGLFVKYLEGIKSILLDMFGEVGAYSGAWTHRVIKAEGNFEPN